MIEICDQHEEHVDAVDAEQVHEAAEDVFDAEDVFERYRGPVYETEGP